MIKTNPISAPFRERFGRFPKEGSLGPGADGAELDSFRATQNGAQRASGSPSTVSFQIDYGQSEWYANREGFQISPKGDGRLEMPVTSAFTAHASESEMEQTITDIRDERVERFIVDPLPHLPGQPVRRSETPSSYTSLPRTLGSSWGIIDCCQEGHSLDAALVPDGRSQQTLTVDYSKHEVSLITWALDEQPREGHPQAFEQWIIADFDPATGRVDPTTSREKVMLEF